MASKTKQPNEMTVQEALEAICGVDPEHDLDCEEGVGSDYCVPCLAEAALAKLRQETK
jgi:hypothetical protein